MPRQDGQGRQTAGRAWWSIGAAVIALPALLSVPAQAQQQAANPHQAHSGMTAAELPGTPTRSLESKEILRAPDGQGQETVVNRTVRAPGTRAPIHYHDAGGLTCVLEGEMTLYLVGAEPQRAVAGQCYYMPSGKEMSGVNSGTQNAVLLDIFKVPVGTPVWRVVEDGMGSVQEQFATKPKP